MRGRFITLEGLNGSGKTTQARWLSEWLRARGIGHLLTAEPGGTRLGRAVRELVLGQPMDPRAELLLFLAARAQHLREVIRPALAEGRHVICVRFGDSTLAYQGYGRGLDLEWIARLQGFVSPDLRPDLTLLLDCPPEVSLQRAGRSGGRFLEEDLDFHRRVRQGFLELQRREPERVRLLDATAAPEAVRAQVRRAVGELIGLTAEAGKEEA